MSDKQTSWGYVTLHDYAVPLAPVKEVALKGLKRFWWRMFSRSRNAPESSRKIEQKSSAEFFRQLFAPPDWQAAFPRLFAQVDEGLAKGELAQVFVGGPHRCTPDMLRDLARAKGWPILEPPSPEEILTGSFTPPRQTHSVMVIPQLAHWYLRHEEGLHVVRDLLGWIHSARQPVVIGCHSWAWSYLEKAICLDAALPQPWVLAPLDETAFRRWLHQLAIVSGGKKAVFREASSGRVVLDLNAPVAKAPVDGSNLLTHIVSESRGLPEISWYLWRQSILHFQEEMLTKDAVKAIADRDEQTIWVPSWVQLKLPELPGKSGHLHLFLVHTLLLHAGLPAEVLPRLIPFTLIDIQRSLLELQRREVIELDENRWRVTAAGYPNLRAALSNECYLVDHL